MLPHALCKCDERIWGRR